MQLVRSFRWRIDNWQAFQQDAANRTYGAAFSAGGFSWRLLLFPRGNTVPFLSLYLAVTSDFQQRLPMSWVKFARFALVVPNRTAPALVKITQHQFDSRENDWGFTQLLELSDLADPAKGWLGDDGSLTVEVLVLPAMWTVRPRRALDARHSRRLRLTRARLRRTSRASRSAGPATSSPRWTRNLRCDSENACCVSPSARSAMRLLT